MANQLFPMPKYLGLNRDGLIEALMAEFKGYREDDPRSDGAEESEWAMREETKNDVGDFSIDRDGLVIRFAEDKTY